MPRLFIFIFSLLMASLSCSQNGLAQMHSVEPGIAVKLEILELPCDRYEQLCWTLDAVARACGSESGDHHRVNVVGVFEGEELNRLLKEVPSKPLVRVECVSTNHVYKIQDHMPDWYGSDSKTRWIGMLEVTSEFLADGEWKIGLQPKREIDGPISFGIPGLLGGPGPRRLRMRPGQVAVIEHPYDIKSEELPKRRLVEIVFPIGSAARERRRQTNVKRLILVQAR